jgi:hypothetical protein
VGEGLTGAGDLSQEKFRDTTRMYVGIWGKHIYEPSNIIWGKHMLWMCGRRHFVRPYSEGVVVHGGAGVVHGQVEEFGDDEAHDAEHAHTTVLDLRLLKKKELRELMYRFE